MASTSRSLNNEMVSKRNALLAYILNNATSKLPLKMTEMAELFGKETKLVNELLPIVTTNLKDVYGIILQEVPDKKSGKKYICYAEDTTPIQEFDEMQKRQTTLLFIILSYIFMSRVSILEDQLEHFLNGLKIFYDKDHDYFGTGIKKMIHEQFVKQLYLNKTKSKSELDVEPKFVFSWGYRANVEFKKLQLLEATAKLMNKDVKFFDIQYQQACKDDATDEDVEMIE